MISAHVSSPNHFDYVAEIWRALSPSERGEFTIGVGCSLAAAQSGIRVRCCRPTEKARRASNPILVASHADAELYHPRPFIMVEHGSGQSYGPVPPDDTTPDYAHTCSMILFLAPNEQCGHRARLHHPHATVTVVGSPKVARWAALRDGQSETFSDFSRVSRRSVPYNNGNGETGDLPVVAFAWHWDSPLHPAACWAFPFWQAAVAELAAMSDAERGYRIVGHGHPRAESRLKGFYRRVGVPWWTAEQVIADADVVVADNTSFMFEAAACGIPVVVLDAPWFDTGGVEFGLRFHEFADIGLRAATGKASELHEVIVRTLGDDPQRARREEISRLVYPIVEGATAACVAAIRSLLA